MPSEHTSVRSLSWPLPLILAAIGLWCTRGVLDIVSEPSGSCGSPFGCSAVIRVAMLPPWWLLAAMIVVLGAAGVAAARAGHNADVVLPLCALGSLAIPYLPWLPDR